MNIAPIRLIVLLWSALTAAGLAAGEWTAWTDRAWSQDPDAARLSSDQRAARLRAQQAEGWFAGPAELELAWLDDRLHAGLGSAERELSLTAPLWQPGERAALRGLASAEQAMQTLVADTHRLRVARDVLDSALSLQVRRARLRHLRVERERTAALALQVAQAVEAGERSPLQRHRAESAHLLAEQALSTARRDLREAVAHWRQLTGAEPPDRLPALPSAVPMQDTLALRVATLELARSEARLRQLDARPREPATLGVQWGAERDAAGERWVDRVGVALAIPLGADADRRRERADALGARDVALRALAQARRQQEDTRRLCAAARRDAERAARRTAERVRLLKDSLKWTERAHAVGEIALDELEELRGEYRAALADEIDSADGLRRARLAEAWARGWQP